MNTSTPVEEWLERWGDPFDAEHYFTEREISDALSAVDGVKGSLDTTDEQEGRIAAELGLSPPSLFQYALGQAERTFGLEGARNLSPVEVGALLWMDGMFVGMLLILLAAGNGEPGP